MAVYINLDKTLQGSWFSFGPEFNSVSTSLTSVLLRSVVVVDLFADSLALAQITSQILLLLLVMVPEQFLPVIWIHTFLLFDDLPLNFLFLRAKTGNRVKKRI